MNTDLELETLIHLLEDGGRTDGRGLRVVSYSSLMTGKEARKKIAEYLRRLQDLNEGDYLGEDQ